MFVSLAALDQGRLRSKLPALSELTGKGTHMAATCRRIASRRARIKAIVAIEHQPDHDLAHDTTGALFVDPDPTSPPSAAPRKPSIEQPRAMGYQVIRDPPQVPA